MIRTRTRASSLPTYQRCPRLWAARQHLSAAQRQQFGLRHLDTHVGAAVGSGSHAGVAHIMAEFQRTGDAGDRQRVAEGIEVAINEFNEIRADGVTYDPVSQNASDAERALRVMIPAYHASIDRDTPPVMVERGMKMTLLDTIEITGHVDLVLVGDIPEDLKTGRHVPQAWPQYGTYSLLIRANGRRVAGHFRERYLPRVAPGKPQRPPTIRLYDQGALEHNALATAKAIDRDVTAFEATGDPDSFVANPTTWLCKDTLCPAWGSTWCNAWRIKEGTIDNE